MTLKDAQEIIKRSIGHSGTYIQDYYGVSVIREAIRTIQDRKKATEENKKDAESVMLTLYRYNLWK